MLRFVDFVVRWVHPRFADSAPALQDHRLDAARLAMRVLVQQAPGASTARLMGGIERAPDLRALWFLRPALMQALAAHRGESGAREALAEVDGLFRQGWPDAPVSRLGALG
jgi:hypothetical protein